LVHGPFCDDEAEFPQNLEDQYKEKESGTRITANSRTVATDGGLGSSNSADPGTTHGGSPDASHLGQNLLNPCMVCTLIGIITGGCKAVPNTEYLQYKLPYFRTYLPLLTCLCIGLKTEEHQAGSVNSESGIGTTANSRTVATNGCLGNASCLGQILLNPCMVQMGQLCTNLCWS
jgi:hypothetical protein